MNKTITIILSAFMVLLVLGSVVGLWSLKQKNYKSEKAKIQVRIDGKTAELNTLKDEVDVNNYKPLDVVSNFFMEAKSNNLETAKLYLSQKYKDTDILKVLGFDFGKDKPVIDGSSFNLTPDGATVDVTFLVKGNANSVEKLFDLAKEEGAWKITNIRKNSDIIGE